LKIPRPPPDPEENRHVLLFNPDLLRQVIDARLFSPTVGDKYVHWDSVRFLTPPKGISQEAWWAAIKLARLPLYRLLPLRDTKGEPFRIGTPDPLQRQLSEADRDLSGRVPVPDQLVNPATRDGYMISALIEEAITSSQLEGASTTRKVAAEMLRSGRRPRDRAERMIFNNFEAMRLIRGVSREPLTPDLVLGIHRRVTDGTLDDPEDAGRLRETDDVAVVTADDDTELHRPPKARELNARLRAMCDFANEKTPDHYLHPIVRAVLLHFWLAYDHPFVDGNGRTARALFYWSMLRSGYWLCEFLSISQILRKAPAKYSRAYLYSESDENDTTYFVLFQLRVLHQAIRALHEYVQERMEAIRAAQSLLKQAGAFNHRQLALLSHALRDHYAQYTVTSHANSHDITRQTARNDLAELAALGFLVATKVGNGFAYHPPADIGTRLERFGKGKRSPGS
jgi:Fic family protein